MQITSENIKTKIFSVTRKGYDREEVNSYLEKISKEFDKNNDEVEELENNLSEANTKLDNFYKIEKKLRDVMISLNEPTHDSILKAKEQIALMLKEAKLKSEEIILTAENEAK